MNLSEFFKSCPSPTRELTKDEAAMLIGLLAHKGMDVPMSYHEFLEHPLVKQEKSNGKELPTSLMAVWTRIARVDSYFKMGLNASLFIASLIKSFGESTIYMSYVMLCAHRSGVRSITLKFLTEKVFPFGVFSDEQLDEMWDRQKVQGSFTGNLLDDNLAWKKHLLGDDVEGKVVVKYGDEDERPLTMQEFELCGEVKEPNEIDGRVFFWLGKSYVSVSKEDYQIILER